MELGIFQKDALIEKLAKAFYRIQGYVVREDYRMQEATHPHEKACVEMAFTAIEEVEFALADVEEDEEEIITWQQGQPLNDGQQYYFCKYGDFVLTLVANSQLTRTEAYLNNQIIYVVEEEVSPNEATRNLQEFLSTLANQLQMLSRIEFEEESE